MAKGFEFSANPMWLIPMLLPSTTITVPLPMTLALVSSSMSKPVFSSRPKPSRAGLVPTE